MEQSHKPELGRSRLTGPWTASVDRAKLLNNFSVLFSPSVLPDYWEDYLVNVEDYIYQFRQRLLYNEERAVKDALGPSWGQQQHWGHLSPSETRRTEHDTQFSERLELCFDNYFSL